MLNIENTISECVNNLWDEFKEHEFTKFNPLSVSEISSEGIIFIGLNPSLSINEEIRNIGGKKQLEFYKHNFKKEDTHRYFHKFIEIGEITNLPWGHFDLLFIRQTNQNKISELLGNKEGLDFIYKQLMISRNLLEIIIEEAHPKLFIVNNTLSRKFLGKDKIGNNNIWMDLEFVWDNSIGTYRYKDIPFYFTSMLTGQRALDLGSYERLIWQIKLII